MKEATLCTNHTVNNRVKRINEQKGCFIGKLELLARQQLKAFGSRNATLIDGSNRLTQNTTLGNTTKGEMVIRGDHHANKHSSSLPLGPRGGPSGPHSRQSANEPGRE